nr:ribosomal protein S18 [Cryptomonas borealis]
MAIYKRKLSPLAIKTLISYKDTDMLAKFLTDQGKILSRKISGLTTKQQTRVTKAIKRARILAFLPFA